MTKFRYMQEPPKDFTFVNLLTNANNKNVSKLSIEALIVLLQNIAMGNLQETMNSFCYVMDDKLI